MNFIKLQTDILKAVEKEKLSGKKSPYHYGYYEKYGKKYIGIVIDTKSLVLIPEKFFYLDLDKCFETIPLKIEKLINDDNTVDTHTDGTVKPVDGNKVQIFKNDKADIWVNINLLKYFDLSISHFRASDKKSPIYIYEDETLVGLVLPINHV